MNLKVIKTFEEVRTILKKERTKMENILNIAMIVSVVVFLGSLLLKFLLK